MEFVFSVVRTVRLVMRLPLVPPVGMDYTYNMSPDPQLRVLVALPARLAIFLVTRPDHVSPIWAVLDRPMDNPSPLPSTGDSTK